MAEILKLTRLGIKVIMINMVRALMEKKWIDNMKTLKDQKEMNEHISRTEELGREVG